MTVKKTNKQTNKNKEKKKKKANCRRVTCDHCRAKQTDTKCGNS